MRDRGHKAHMPIIHANLDRSCTATNRYSIFGVNTDMPMLSQQCASASNQAAQPRAEGHIPPFNGGSVRDTRAMCLAEQRSDLLLRTLHQAAEHTPRRRQRIVFYDLQQTQVFTRAQVRVPAPLTRYVVSKDALHRLLATVQAIHAVEQGIHFDGVPPKN